MVNRYQIEGPFLSRGGLEYPCRRHYIVGLQVGIVIGVILTRIWLSL